MHLLCNETALRLGYNLAIYVADCQLANGSAGVHVMKSLVKLSAFTNDMHFLSCLHACLIITYRFIFLYLMCTAAQCM